MFLFTGSHCTQRLTGTFRTHTVNGCKTELRSKAGKFPRLYKSNHFRIADCFRSPAFQAYEMQMAVACILINRLCAIKMMLAQDITITKEADGIIHRGPAHVQLCVYISVKLIDIEMRIPVESLVEDGEPFGSLPHFPLLHECGKILMQMRTLFLVNHAAKITSIAQFSKYHAPKNQSFVNY